MGVAKGRRRMEVPVHDVVNTGEETFRNGSGVSGFINVCLTRQSASQPWGFRLQGGKDRGLPFQLLKVPLDSIASHSGAKSGDYLVKIGGHDVFHLNHEEAKELIRQGGNKLLLVVERGEMIVPSLNSAFPKPKEEIIEEIMTQGTALGKEIDPNNPWNMTGKEFDPTKSGVLSAIMEREPEAQPAHHHLP